MIDLTDDSHEVESRVPEVSKKAEASKEQELLSTSKAKPPQFKKPTLKKPNSSGRKPRKPTAAPVKKPPHVTTQGDVTTFFTKRRQSGNLSISQDTEATFSTVEDDSLSGSTLFVQDDISPTANTSSEEPTASTSTEEPTTPESFERKIRDMTPGERAEWQQVYAAVWPEEAKAFLANADYNTSHAEVFPKPQLQTSSIEAEVTQKRSSKKKVIQFDSDNSNVDDLGDLEVRQTSG
jgi:hypothetical protein